MVKIVTHFSSLPEIHCFKCYTGLTQAMEGLWERGWGRQFQVDAGDELKWSGHLNGRGNSWWSDQVFSAWRVDSKGTLRWKDSVRRDLVWLGAEWGRRARDRGVNMGGGDGGVGTTWQQSGRVLGPASHQLTRTKRRQYLPWCTHKRKSQSEPGENSTKQSWIFRVNGEWLSKVWGMVSLVAQFSSIK